MWFRLLSRGTTSYMRSLFLMVHYFYITNQNLHTKSYTKKDRLILISTSEDRITSMKEGTVVVHPDLLAG